MSFKNPIKVANLSKLKGGQYLKMTAVILKKKFLSGNTAPFIILLNHIYAGFDEKKSERMPFFLLGDRQSDWKDYHKTKTEDDKPQKEFMISGTCRRSENEFVLDIDGSKGLKKIPRKTVKFLDALLQKIDKNFSVTTTGGSAGEIDEELQKTKVDDVQSETKNSAEEMTRDLKHSQEMTAYKEARQKEAKDLSKAITKLSSLMGKSLKSVADHVKKGATSGKDIEVVKAANAAYVDVMEIYKKAKKPVRQQFASAYKKLTNQKEQLIKLSLAAKQRKKSVAQRLADGYYEEKKNRVATDDEISVVNGITKKILKQHKKVDQKYLLKMLSFLFGKVGVKEDVVLKYAGQIVAQKAA
jgi:hypothetical protein